MSSGPTGRVGYSGPTPRLQTSHTVTFEVSSGPTGGELFQPHTQTPNYPHCYLWGVLRTHRGWAIPAPYPDSKLPTLTFEVSSGPTGGELFQPHTQTPNYPHLPLRCPQDPQGVSYSSPIPRLQTTHTVTFEVSSGPTGGELFQPHTQTPNEPRCYLWGVLRAHRGRPGRRAGLCLDHRPLHHGHFHRGLRGRFWGRVLVGFQRWGRGEHPRQFWYSWKRRPRVNISGRVVGCWYAMPCQPARYGYVQHCEGTVSVELRYIN